MPRRNVPSSSSRPWHFLQFLLAKNTREEECDPIVLSDYNDLIFLKHEGLFFFLLRKVYVVQKLGSIKAQLLSFIYL